MSHLILHIGTHKTGSTSIQKFLKDNDGYLQANGLVFVSGLNRKPNFKALFHAACSPNRRALMTLKQPGLFSRLFLRWRIKRHLQSVQRRYPNKSIVVSTELLSLLREPEEIETLRGILPAECKLTVVVCLREKAAFLASMRRQLAAQRIEFSSKQGRSDYVEMDSWLVDYDALLGCFRTLTTDIRIVDFDDASKVGKNIILPFVRELGVSMLPDENTLPFLNKRVSHND